MMTGGLSRCNQELIGGALSKMAGLEIPLGSSYVCVAHHTPNLCQEDERAAGTYQAYWIFIAVVAS